MASIRKRPGRPSTKKDGPPGKDAYIVSWVDPNGKQKSRSFDRQAPAKQFKARIETVLAVGDYIDPHRGRIPLEKLAADWTKHRVKKGAANTRAANSHRLEKHILPHLGHFTLDRIDDDAILDWLDAIAHLAPTTQRAIWTTLNSVLISAVEKDLLPKNPLSKRALHTAPIVKTSIIPWTADMVTGMAETIAPRYRLAVVVGAGLGLRQGEIFGLAVDDVNFARRTVRIRRQVLMLTGDSSLAFSLPKGEKTRDVPLPDSVMVEIQRHMAAYPPQTVTLPWSGVQDDGEPHTANLLLSTREHHACNKNTFNTTAWRPARERVGIPAVNPDRHKNGMHQLRHFYVSVLLDSGEPIHAVAQHVGHEDMAYMLKVYAHMMPESNARSMAAIDAAFESASWTNLGREVPEVEPKGL